MANTELQTTNHPNGTAENRQNGAQRIYTPRVDIADADDALYLYADLPGVKPEDIALTCKGEELILHARCVPRYKGGKFLHAEYGIGDFHRSFTITEEIDQDGIEAALTGGVLTVRVPKAEAVRPKRIAVKGTPGS